MDEVIPFVIVILIGGGIFVWFVIVQYKDENEKLSKELKNVESKLFESETWVRRFQHELNSCDRQEEVETVKREIANITQNLLSKKRELQTVNTDIISAKKILGDLQDDISRKDFEFPNFKYDISDEYKQRIESCRTEQKETCSNAMTISFNKGYDFKLLDSYIKVSMALFNLQCDNFIKSVDWDNYFNIADKIGQSYVRLASIGVKFGINFNNSYLRLKLEEAQLVYEYKLKKYQEREEQKEIRARMREEAKAERELKRNLKLAEREEEKYKEKLENTRSRLELAFGAERERMQKRIAELEEHYNEAVKNKERALSMAQQTKRGYVYIISNIGSFGDNIYKIGLTRRLDPNERVRELGGASVPYPFDVHAFILSDDAPALEATLHRELSTKRVNLINRQKEFFHVTLDEIEGVVNKLGEKMIITKPHFHQIPDAKDYRLSEANRQKAS